MNEGLLDRLRGLNLGVAPAPPRPAADAWVRRGSIPGRVEALAPGAVHVAEWRVPRAHPHGAWTLDAHGEWRALTAAAASRDARFRDTDPAGWLFIDTETTSLNSGAGVWVFMVGLGRFEGDDFLVRQYFLSDPGAERALLTTVHAEISSAAAVVSFHGKSFDAPRLDDRFRLVGLDPVLVDRPHFDLLHPLRRLFGHGLPDCKLRTVEEHLLGFRRIGDLPGALCPEAYFAYLRGRPHRLPDVFEHNRLDVLSLSALAGNLAAAYCSEGGRSSALRRGLDWVEAGEGARAATFLRAAVDEDLVAPMSVALAAARWLVRLEFESDASRMLERLAVRDPLDLRPQLALRRLERRLRPGVASVRRVVTAGQGPRQEASIQA